MKHSLKYITRLAFVLFLSFSVLQGRAEGDPCNPGDDPDAPCDPACDPLCPIDGGVVALLAAGVGYGIKRARDSRKTEVEEGA